MLAPAALSSPAFRYRTRCSRRIRPPTVTIGVAQHADRRHPPGAINVTLGQRCRGARWSRRCSSRSGPRSGKSRPHRPRQKPRSHPRLLFANRVLTLGARRTPACRRQWPCVYVRSLPVIDLGTVRILAKNSVTASCSSGAGRARRIGRGARRPGTRSRSSRVGRRRCLRPAGPGRTIFVSRRELFLLMGYSTSKGSSRTPTCAVASIGGANPGRRSRDPLRHLANG